MTSCITLFYFTPIHWKAETVQKVRKNKKWLESSMLTNGCCGNGCGNISIDQERPVQNDQSVSCIFDIICSFKGCCLVYPLINYLPQSCHVVFNGLSMGGIWGCPSRNFFLVKIMNFLLMCCMFCTPSVCNDNQQMKLSLLHGSLTNYLSLW